MRTVESIVIVKSAEDRLAATVRTESGKNERILSSSSHEGIYKAIDKYMNGEI